MFTDENPVLEILEVIKEQRSERSFATRKRNISVLSCRTDGCGVFSFNSQEITADLFRKKFNTYKKPRAKRLLPYI